MGTEFFDVHLFATATYPAPLAAIVIAMFSLSCGPYHRLSSNDSRPSPTLDALETPATFVDRTLVLHSHPGATGELTLLSRERLHNSNSLQDRDADPTSRIPRDRQERIL